MGILDSILRADAALVFCDPNGFGEPVVYTFNPTGAAPASKTYNAVVYRLIPEQLPGGGMASPVIEIELPNDPSGVNGPAAINKNGDTITVADRQGGNATVHQINAVMTQDAGMWRLRLR